MKKLFQCELCEETYDNEIEARDCEATGLRDKLDLKVGDVVTSSPCYGWFDGDPLWVSNLSDLVEAGNVIAETGRATLKDRKCPRGDSNCFGSCCNFLFYWVVTALTSEKHRQYIHLNTLACGQAHGRTVNRTHIIPTLINQDDVPAYVHETKLDMIGEEFSDLL